MQTKEVTQSSNNRRRFTEKREYTNYRESVPEELRFIGRDNYNTMVYEYFNSIGELLTEYDGGVCVDKCFYLFLYKIKKKMSYRISNKRFYNKHSDNHIYTITMMFPKRFKHWVIRKKGFDKHLKKKIVSILKTGRKLRAHFYSLRVIRKI